MPTALAIEKQRFTFGDKWTIAFKYDDTKFYREGPERLKGDLEGATRATRAVDVVDVVGLHAAAGLLLLEAKDFRGHRIENKTRIKHREIVVEVALKVRDTVAGLIGAARQNVSEFDSAEIKKACNRGKDLVIVLWLEDDASKDALRWKQQLEVLTQEMKAKMSWLDAKFFVLSHSTQNRLPDLTVTNLPGAGQP